MVTSCLALKALIWVVWSGRVTLKNPDTTPKCVPFGKSAEIGNWHFKSLTPSFWPDTGSGTSDTEHVPPPWLLTFTETTKDSTLNVRGNAARLFNMTCAGAFQT